MSDSDRASLEKAFDLVKPAENWKNPISALVPNDADFDLIGEAVTYYTGSVIEVSDSDQEGFKLVEAAGYYMTIGS